MKLTFKGIDASNEISLLEYGLIVSNEEHEDGSGTHFCVFSIGNNMYDYGHISEKQIDGYVTGKEFPDKDDIKSFLSYVGMTKKQWLRMTFESKLHDLMQYWGYENIMGSAYYPMTEKEAIERYLK